jgi:hypothetical protein
LSLLASYYWWQLLVVADECGVAGLKTVYQGAAGKHRKLTPFIRGMREAGSVDIEASSKKTTGKSMMSNARDPELIHVVHTWRCL